MSSLCQLSCLLLLFIGVYKHSSQDLIWCVKIGVHIWGFGSIVGSDYLQHMPTRNTVYTWNIGVLHRSRYFSVGFRVIVLHVPGNSEHTRVKMRVLNGHCTHGVNENKKAYYTPFWGASLDYSIDWGGGVGRNQMGVTYGIALMKQPGLLSTSIDL